MIDYEKLEEAHQLGIFSHYYLTVEIGHKKGFLYNVMSKENYGEIGGQAYYRAQDCEMYYVGTSPWILKNNDTD